MDSNFTIKPRPGVLPRSNALRDPVTVREASDTELDPAKAVAPADSGGKQDSHAQHHEQPKHDVIIDPGARDALFQAVDIRTGHGEPSPNQALMRQRAYHAPSTANQAASPAAPSDSHADIEA
jgi:hypothetical protein